VWRLSVDDRSCSCTRWLGNIAGRLLRRSYASCWPCGPLLHMQRGLCTAAYCYRRGVVCADDRSCSCTRWLGNIAGRLLRRSSYSSCGPCGLLLHMQRGLCVAAYCYRRGVVYVDDRSCSCTRWLGNIAGRLLRRSYASCGPCGPLLHMQRNLCIAAYCYRRGVVCVDDRSCSYTRWLGNIAVSLPRRSHAGRRLF